MFPRRKSPRGSLVDTPWRSATMAETVISAVIPTAKRIHFRSHRCFVSSNRVGAEFGLDSSVLAQVMFAARFAAAQNGRNGFLCSPGNGFQLGVVENRTTVAPLRQNSSHSGGRNYTPH